MNLTVLVERLNLETFFIFKLGHCEIQIKPRPVPRPAGGTGRNRPLQIQNRPLIKGAVMLAILRSLKICTRLLHDARIQDVAPI